MFLSIFKSKWVLYRKFHVKKFFIFWLENLQHKSSLLSAGCHSNEKVMSRKICPLKMFEDSKSSTNWSSLTFSWRDEVHVDSLEHNRISLLIQWKVWEVAPHEKQKHHFRQNSRKCSHLNARTVSLGYIFFHRQLSLPINILYFPITNLTQTIRTSINWTLTTYLQSLELDRSTVELLCFMCNFHLLIL